jgi:hypothetical protein
MVEQILLEEITNSSILGLVHPQYLGQAELRLVLESLMQVEEVLLDSEREEEEQQNSLQLLTKQEATELLGLC